MPNPSTPQKVLCTFLNCPRRFNTVEEMKKHKSSAPEHEYCTRCDEDFENEERHMIHKIKSNKHIVCPICGVDFKSEGGRDIHIHQMHRAKQTLTCYGCKAIFHNASGLMKHIEDDECPEITKRRLLQERSKKIMIKQALTGGVGSALPIIPRPGDADDVDGGVKVNMNPLEYDNREAMANPPKSGDGGAALSQKHWPELKTAAKARAADNPTPADLMAFFDLAIADKAGEGEWKGKGRLITIAESEKENDESENLFAVGTPDAGKVLRFLQNNWDPTTFFDSYSGEYVCPCKKRFKTMKQFEEHMLMKSQGARGIECPKCHRRFKTAAALVAHCEAPSRRCNINTHSQFGTIIDDVSSGVIQAAGYMPDGTVKYEAGKLELTKTTTIGVDLEKNKW
ncbi:hypothetical protein CNMCM5793_007515 [Aspergillus hiratsukae]|uniref:C2H2-type domain-containing protein n=1 Tax=Aspergillus hiratsukae TaxID=1194566 RepID=A0A8H6P5Q6_9EURO|nr:hypothetical protein CNMCM5793_007515 [Aspergillus hiratsukae]KAF7171595.1 hypothetical protein CNMCM6106_006025 [Aspergillus hiratsukae]